MNLLTQDGKSKATRGWILPSANTDVSDRQHIIWLSLLILQIG
jgi:hypothetical protein